MANDLFGFMVAGSVAEREATDAETVRLVAQERRTAIKCTERVHAANGAQEIGRALERKARVERARAERRLSRAARAQEALERAQSGSSARNEAMVIAAFSARGIPEHEIRPRENVLTFQAWLAKGRAVRKGERGVKVLTFRPIEVPDPKDPAKARTITTSRPWSSTVFHVSQTDPARG